MFAKKRLPRQQSCQTGGRLQQSIWLQTILSGSRVVVQSHGEQLFLCRCSSPTRTQAGMDVAEWAEALFVQRGRVCEHCYVQAIV